MITIEEGFRDDSEEFAIFALFNKLEKHPEKLTPLEKIALQSFGIGL